MRITIEVKTGAKEEKITELSEDRYHVQVKERRKKGKANAAVLKLLRRHFGKPVHIISGITSSTKIVEIEEDA